MIFFIEDSYESADLKILKKKFGCLCGRMLNGIFSSNLGGVYLFLCKISREIRKSQRKVDLSTANQCSVHFCQPVAYAILLTWCDQRYCTYQIPLHPPV